MKECNGGNPQIDYESFRKNPLDLRRKSTDRYFTYLFIAISFLWISLVITATTMEDEPEYFQPYNLSELIIPKLLLQQNVISKMSQETVKTFYKSSPPAVTMIGVCLALLCIVIFLITLRYHTKFWIYVGMFFLVPFVILLVLTNIKLISRNPRPSGNATYNRMVSLYETIINGDDYTAVDNYFARFEAIEGDVADQIVDYQDAIMGEKAAVDGLDNLYKRPMLVMKNSVVGLYYLTVICCFVFCVSLNEVSVIAKNVFRFFFSFQGLIPLGIVICLIQGCFMHWSMRSFITFTTHTPLSYASRTALCFAIGLSGAYLVSFTSYYALAVVSQMTAVWHWADTNERIPSSLFSRCLSTVTRYHLGTIAFNATIIPPVIVALFVACFTKRKDCNRTKLTDVLLYIYLMFNIMDYSTTVTAIKGQNCFNATKTTYRSLTKNSSLCLSFIFIYSTALFIVTTILALICGLPYIVWYSQHTVINFVILAPVAIGFYTMFLLPILVISSCIEKANLFCTIEEEENLYENTYPMIQMQ